jgi:hypothetical protein
VRAKQLGVRNTEARFDAISLGLVADGDTAARLSFNTNGHDAIFIGGGLQLGLEFLVAADVISTVTVEPTMEKILSLGLLIVVRTLLSWSKQAKSGIAAPNVPLSGSQA